MYFNIKNEQGGNLFVKPFRSKHIADDEYMQHVVQYIHLNPLEIFEPNWKSGLKSISASLEKKLREYPYSSLASYDNEKKCCTNYTRCVIDVSCE